MTEHSITFTLSEQQYVKACFRLARLSLVIRCLIITSVFFVLLSFENDFGVADYIGSGIVILLVASLLPYYFWKRRVKRLYHDELGLQVATTVSFNDEGCLMESEKGSVRISWGEFKKCIDTEDFFLMFTSKRFARIIPKQDMDTVSLDFVKQQLSKVGVYMS